MLSVCDLKPTMLVDIDGVIANLCERCLYEFCYDYNDNLSLEDIKSWDTHKYVKPECGLKIYNYIKDPRIYDNVFPYPDALDGINELRKFSDIIYVTSFAPGFSYRKYQWLKDFKFLHDEDEYIEVDKMHKYLIRGDFLIDDSLDNCKEFHHFTGNYSFLMDRPWNKYEYFSLRMFYWEDIINCLKDLSK